MRKYRLARIFAWIVVGSGIALSLMFIILGIVALVSPLAGNVPAFQAMFASVSGLIVALVGFVFLAVFDVAEAIARHCSGQERGVN